MGLFDIDDALMDWNGDGRIDRWDTAIETAVIMNQLDQQEKGKQPGAQKNPGAVQYNRFRK